MRGHPGRFGRTNSRGRFLLAVILAMVASATPGCAQTGAGRLGEAERAARVRLAIDPATDDKTRYEAVYAMAVGGYSPEAARALGSIAAGREYSAVVRWNAAMGLRNFTPEMPEPVRESIRGELRLAAKVEQDKLPAGPLYVLNDWGDADWIVEALGKNLRVHQEEVDVLARVRSREFAVARLWEIYQTAATATTRAGWIRRRHVGTVLLERRDKRGVNALLECLTVTEPWPADEPPPRYPEHPNAVSFRRDREAILRQLRGLPGMSMGCPDKAATSPAHLADASAKLAAWWKAHCDGWEFGVEPAAAVAACAKYPPNLVAIPDRLNEFARSNPAYKKRAGEFYEQEYLGRAVEQLAAAGLTAGEKAAAEAILRAYIYDWLDAFVRADGKMTAQNLERLLRLTDERFRGELNDAKYAAYLAWRGEKSEADNAMRFLMWKAVDVEASLQIIRDSTRPAR